MILSDTDVDAVNKTHEAESEVEIEQTEPALIRFGHLFRRDLWCWANALKKRWWLLAALPFTLAVATFVIRTLTTSKVYVANCGLIRQEISDTRNQILPPGYVSVQRSIIMTMFKSRAVLEETNRRLNLPYSSEQLFNNIKVNSEKNSNYFYLSATSKDPAIAATVANTLSEVFIEEYKKLIRSNLEALCESYVRSQNELEKALSDLEDKQKKINAENNLTGIERDIDLNNQRLLQNEDQLTRSAADLDSAKQRLYELEGELANTEEEVVTHREKSTAADSELLAEQRKLREYEQIYAPKNPILVRQRNLVQTLKKNAERIREENDDKDSRVVIARNPVYSSLMTAVATQKAQITGLNNDIKLYNEVVVQLRARRELLSTLLPTVRQLENDIEQHKNQIAKTRLQVVDIRNFLDRSFSDISIQELAKAPNVSLSRKRGVWAVIGFIFGAAVALLILLGHEFFNLTIRSIVDIEKALKLPALGVIPTLDQDHRANYYSALQTMVSNGEEFFAAATPENPILLTFAPNKRADFDAETRTEFCEALKIRLGSNYVIIAPADEAYSAKQTPLLINDYLYQFTDEPPKVGKDRTLYFKLDDLSFISPPTPEQINRLKTAFPKTSLIVWDLFEFNLHRQLFAEIARTSDLTVIPMNYGLTSKLDIYRMMQFLKQFNVKRIVGFLFHVNNIHYSKVTL